MIPLYGFLEGDTVGVILLCRDDARISEVRAKLEQAVRLRAAPPSNASVRFDGRILDPSWTVTSAGLRPLDRVDVVAGSR